MFETIDSRSIFVWLRRFLAIGILFLVLTVAFYFFSRIGEELSTANEAWGQFGDYLGGVLNPVFGFLAFMGLLVTIALQARELDQAREMNQAAIEQRDAQSKLQTQQNEQIVKELRLSDLDKAIRKQSESIDLEIDLDHFTYTTNKPDNLSFSFGIRQFALKESGLPCSNGYESRTFGEDARAKAEFVCTLLHRLGRLLGKYDDIYAPYESSGPHEWYYTNTWRFQYDTFIADLVTLKVEDADIVLPLFEGMD